MAQPHPSLALVLDVDERLFSKELRQEVARCFAFVGSTVVRAHDAAEGDPENTARIMVKLGNRRYLNSSDEGADELWENVVERWLASELQKVGNHLRIFNRRQREEGREPLEFAWMEVRLQNGELSLLLRCDSTSSVDPRASKNVSAVRDAYNRGAMGAGVRRVVMPAPADYEQQRQAGLEAKAEREAQEKAAAQAEEEARAQAAAQAEERAEELFLESPELLAAQRRQAEEQAAAEEAAYRERLAHAHGDEPPAHEAAVVEGGGEVVGDRFALPEADFALDYSVWQVEYEDGTVRTYDSGTATLSA